MSSRPDLVAALLHSIEYLGLLGGLGSFVVRRLAAMKPRLTWVRPPMHIAFGAALAGGFLLLLHNPSWPAALRAGCEGVAFYLCVSGTRYVAPFGVLAALLFPFSSHAANVFPAAGAEFADALHVLSAAMWAGGILALASLRPPGGWGGEEAHVLLGRFGRIAFIAFGVTALTGVLRATEQLVQVSDLWSTTYGVVLTLKSAGVLMMVALSAVGWRRRSSISRAEAATTVAVVALTAVLASIPVDAG